MKKLRLLSAAALTVMMVAAAPAMTSQAAMFTTCVPGNSSGIIFNSGMLSGGFGQRGGAAMTVSAEAARTVIQEPDGRTESRHFLHLAECR